MGTASDHRDSGSCDGHRMGLSAARFANANIIMVYLLGVLLTSAFTSGYTCGVLSAFLSVILFNYFLTEPRLSLAAYGSKYPITFAVMFAAALLTSTLAPSSKPTHSYPHGRLSHEAPF